MSETNSNGKERIDSREFEPILKADDALPYPVECHRTGEEINCHDNLVFLEDGEPVADKRHADEVIVGRRAGGYFRNKMGPTSWVKIKDRTKIRRPFLSRLKSRISKHLQSDSDTNE